MTRKSNFRMMPAISVCHNEADISDQRVFVQVLDSIGNRCLGELPLVNLGGNCFSHFQLKEFHGENKGVPNSEGRERLEREGSLDQRMTPTAVYSCYILHNKKLSRI